jgi:hypothetical protein
MPQEMLVAHPLLLEQTLQHLVLQQSVAVEAADKFKPLALVVLVAVEPLQTKELH